MGLTSLYGQVNSFTPQSDLSHLRSLHCQPPYCTHYIFIILSHLFSACFLEASTMAHSFPSMWSFFLLRHASWCHCSLSPPWTWCFSMMLLCCIFLLFFLRASFPYPSFFLGAMPCSLLSLVLWQAHAFSPHTICPMLCWHSTDVCEVPLTHPGL